MPKNKNLFITEKNSIEDAIKAINKGAKQIALVIKNKKLIGLITDGDIRRGLLEGLSFDDKVEKVMKKDFFYLLPDYNKENILSLMNQKGLKHIPILSKAQNFEDLIFIDDLLKSKKIKTPIVFMAGGLGKRLMPLTENKPKPMLEISGKPILERLMLHNIMLGFKNFYISVNYLKSVIIDHFGDGSKWGVNISYIEEKKPLGTAGALSLIDIKYKSPFIIMNGDLMTYIDTRKLLKFHNAKKPALTLGVNKNFTEIPYGVVETQNNKVLKIVEKPVLSHFVNAGIYVINPSYFSILDKDQKEDMPNFIKKIIEKNKKVLIYPISEFWQDVGTPDSFYMAQKIIEEKE